jgi:hypothetical protein
VALFALYLVALIAVYWVALFDCNIQMRLADLPG